MTHSLSSAEDLSRETCKGVEALRQRQTLEGTRSLVSLSSEPFRSSTEISRRRAHHP